MGTGSQAASKSFLVTADDPMATYTIDFYYTEAEINDWIAGFGGVDAPTIDDFRLFKTSAASVDGITSENTIVDMNTSRTDYIVDGVNGYRFSASFTGFSVFGGGNVSGGALPVSWLSFSGKEKNRQTHLEWSTGSESNAEGFEVEWSVDNKTWETVGEVKANNQASSYGFVHPKPAVGYNFYRIQQIDIDGKTSYSNMIVITLEKEAVFELAVQPNPATDKINVEISNSSENFVQLTITSLNGQVIKNERIQVTENRQVQLDISNLPQGIYLLRANNNIDQFVQKLVVY